MGEVEVGVGRRRGRRRLGEGREASWGLGENLRGFRDGDLRGREAEERCVRWGKGRASI